MPQAHLVACPWCSRHVRVSESCCPFCGGRLSEMLRATPAPRAPTVRVSRAALYALGATTAGLVAACTTISPLYGGPPGPPYDGGERLDSGPSPNDGESPEDAGADTLGGALYGGPPRDSGEAESGSTPAYGAPPQDL
jgi:hypothetical protein